MLGADCGRLHTPERPAPCENPEEVHDIHILGDIITMGALTGGAIGVGSVIGCEGNQTGMALPVALDYTGDLNDPSRATYDLKYYVGLARELADAGTHILGIKDMGGLCKPEAARELVRVLKEETGLPIHFHTHDTSGISAASVLAAAEAGCDAVDLAMDPLSGMTSQPNFGSVVEALRASERDTGFDPATIREFCDYWEAVRGQYAAFEAGLEAPGTEDEDEFDPFAGVDRDGRIPKVALPDDLPNPERWRYIPEGRLKPGNLFQRFLVSSFLAPFVFRSGDVGWGGGIALTDIDFRTQRRREFAGAFLSYTEKGQQKKKHGILDSG